MAACGWRRHCGGGGGSAARQPFHAGLPPLPLPPPPLRMQWQLPQHPQQPCRRPGRAASAATEAGAAAAVPAATAAAGATAAPPPPPTAATSCRRRGALLSVLLAAAAAGPPAGRAGQQQPQGPAAPREPEPAAAKDPSFYARWPYAGPEDILPFIEHEVAPGDAQGVLDAMDAFSAYYPAYKIGPEKGALLEAELAAARPATALELGTFLGYSAIRTARQLPPGGLLVCVEANPDNAAVARRLLEYAGVARGGRRDVVVLGGLASRVAPALPALLAGRGIEPARFGSVFLDHCKSCYAPDLQQLERLELVGPGSLLLADNVVYPGAPGFLEYLESSGRWRTRLLPARYEYEQAWNPEWEPKMDAMSASVWAG